MMHGIGLKLAVYLSDYCDVTSCRDGKSVTRKYEDGFFKKEIVKDSTEHGTYIRMSLSPKYLKETDKVSCSNVMKMIEEKTDACPEISIKFKGVKKNGSLVNETFKGLDTEDLFKKYCTATSKVWYMEYEPKDSYTKCRMAFGYNSKAVTDSESTIHGWCNYIKNKEGGTHIDAIVDSIYDYFKKYMLKDFLSDKDKKDLQIKREDIKLGLCGVTVLLTNEPEYQGRTYIAHL